MPGHPDPASPPAALAPYGILKRLSYLMSAKLLREALLALFYIYLARLSATTFGDFMLALGLGSILRLVAEFELNLPLVGLLSHDLRKPGETLMQVLLLKTGFLLLALTGAVAFVTWQSYAGPLLQVVLIVGLGMGLEALASTFFVAFQVQGRQDLEGKIKSAAATLGCGYGLISLLLGAPPVAVAFFKLIESLINLLGGAVLLFSPRLLRGKSFTWQTLGRTVRQGIVFALIGITNMMYSKANLFFLQRYGGAEGVAQYSVTWQLVEGIALLASTLLLQNVLFPLFVKLWEEDRQQVSRLAQKTARWLLAAALTCVLVLYLESDRIITLIYGSHYQPAIWLQKYLVITIIFASFHHLASFLMISMRQERLLLLFSLLGLGFNLLCCAALIKATPLLGAALAMVFTKAGMALLTGFYVERQFRFIPWRAFRQMALAVLVGVALYLLGQPLPRRGFRELLALAPVLLVAWLWWRQPRPNP
jgi:O-antigen/teichoic acid export membrane protein